MNLAEITHRAYFLDCYPLDERHLKISIQTGKDVDEVILWAGDPYSAGIAENEQNWQGERVPMELERELAHRNVYSAVLTPAYRRVKYHFEITGGGESVCLYEDGFVKAGENFPADRMIQRFIYPWMNRADVMKVPEWAENIVWYQIFPDRFCNGTPEKNGDDITPWRNHGTVTNEEKFGGNLEGIRQRLSYLQELGITGIYLNPIMKAESNHKYDTTDYTKIDPFFGDADTMKALCKEAHEKGIRIMVDAVFNHSGRKFEPWIDILEHGKESRYADWFMVEDWEQVQKRGDTRDRRFYSFAFTDGMPKLNTNNEEVIQYFCKICEDWVREFDIDGIRFDVGNEVSHRFLKRIREHLKTIKPDIYLLGEIWHDASQWLQGDEYDSVMNYPLLSGIHDFFLDKTMKKEQFEYMVNRCYTMYMQQNNDVLFNLLDSHDTERLMNRFHDLDKFYQQLAILFTLPGSPCIYYGTEIAMEGAHDPDCRRCMPWSEIESEENQKKIATMRKLIMLRRNEKVCRSLHFHFPNGYENDRCVEYIKLDEEGNKIEVLLNASDEEIKVKGDGEVLFAREFDGEILGVNGTLIRRM